MLSEESKLLLVRALAERDRAAIAQVPKTDLHCHALLSAPREAYEQLLGGAVTPPPRRFESFSDFTVYIVTHLFPALTGEQAVRTLIRAAFARMAADGVVYAEISFDLLLPEFIRMQAEEFAEIISEESARVADRLSIAPEIGISRSLPPDEVAPRLRRWIAAGVFRSIDLYDDENLGDLHAFVPLYRLAEENGLKLKAHAGELRGAQLVRDSVEALHLHAVQHGARAAEDPAVMSFLAERGTLLHVCPTSNHALRLCDGLENHPARQLFDAGVKITVNTDDFTIFGAGVSDELLNLTKMAFSPAEIAQIIDTGLAEIPSP
jgi:adenosine deaminase